MPRHNPIPVEASKLEATDERIDNAAHVWSLTPPPLAMDPLSIIGLTSGIITFIDAGSNFIALARGVYSSPTGQPEELDRIEQFSGELEDISNHLASLCLSTPQTSAQRSLVAASKNCAGTCREMLELIGRCTAWREAKELAEEGCDACSAKEKVLKEDDIPIIAKKEANVHKLRKVGPRPGMPVPTREASQEAVGPGKHCSRRKVHFEEERDRRSSEAP